MCVREDIQNSRVLNKVNRSKVLLFYRCWQPIKEIAIQQVIMYQKDKAESTRKQIKTILLMGHFTYFRFFSIQNQIISRVSCSEAVLLHGFYIVQCFRISFTNHFALRSCGLIYISFCTNTVKRKVIFIENVPQQKEKSFVPRGKTFQVTDKVCAKN